MTTLIARTAIAAVLATASLSAASVASADIFHRDYDKASHIRAAMPHTAGTAQVSRAAPELSEGKASHIAAALAETRGNWVSMPDPARKQVARIPYGARGN